MDVLISSSGLLLLSPVMLGIAIAVWCETGNPILFRQERVGRGFVRFSIIKFRTMRTRSSGLPVTVAGDARVTRVGKFLRITKLDELPQLWNVLRGDMSLVGPRPEVPNYVALYKERFERILSVRPGITDLASIQFRDEEEVLAKCQDPMREYRERVLPKKLDLADEYVRKRGCGMDLAIIWRTLVVILFPDRVPKSGLLQ